MEESGGGPTIVLIGASVRALAYSARRAGYRPIAFDLFADRDLRTCAQAHRLARHEYPSGLAKLAGQIAGRPWMYTGGIENHPDLVDQLAEAGPLWGNPGAVLRRVRDPFQFHAVLHQAGLSALPVADHPNEIPADGSWLQKPVAGAGGLGIRPWTGGAAPGGVYFQQRAPGLPHSAVFVASGGAAVLLGVTRQLVGERDFAAPPFAYCGSIGPLCIAEAVRSQLERIGAVLARSFGLAGIFGIDFLLDEATVRAVEVNPRYPASMEVIELAGGPSAVGLQQAAVTGKPLPEVGANALQMTCVAKAVLYADRWCRLRPAARCYGALLPLTGCGESAKALFADVPDPEAFLAPNEPILSILQPAPDPQEGLRLLRATAQEIVCADLDNSCADNRAGTLLRNAYRLRCPVCKEGRIFPGWLAIADKCPTCHVTLDRQGGDFLGSIYFNYAATGVPVIAGYLVGRFAFDFPDRWLLSGLLCFAIVFPLYYLRYARALWLAFDQFFDPRQPARTEATAAPPHPLSPA